MHTIVMTGNKLLVHTIKNRIICGEAKVDTIRFLVPTLYGEEDLSTYTAAIKFKIPSGDTLCEVLSPQEELYKDEYLDYRLTLTSKFTSEPGIVDFCLEFIKAQDEDSFKLFSKYSSILISPHNAINRNEQFDDTKLSKLEKSIADLQSKKADDIEIIDGEIWLTSDGKPIGDPIQQSSGPGGIVWKEI